MDKKPIRWVGDSKEIISGSPNDAKRTIGFGLHAAELGEEAPTTRPLIGFNGRSVLEVRANSSDGSTYRAVYTVRFAEVLYVLHAFEKKSTTGIKTSPRDIAHVELALKAAEEDYKLRGA